MLDLVLHLDVHLLKLVAEYGVWIYAILFAIIFSETGFVVTPFLPGEFYERHGGKAVVLSRFLPIVRTYVPFVAGMAIMTPRQYTIYNVAGGAAWVGSLTYAGYFFGNIPWVRGNLTAIIVGIVVVSLLPLAYAFLKSRLQRGRPA